MKDLSEKLNEQLLTEARVPVLKEIQGDSSKAAAYSTFSIDEAKKKYMHGFLSYDKYEKAVFTVAFNAVEDLQDLLDTDDDDYSQLLNMKPQEFMRVNEILFICLW